MATITETEPQAQAIITDATQRLAELEAVRDVLLPDVGDAAVVAELAQIESEIRAAVAAMSDERADVAQSFPDEPTAA
jgi:hypothetical protein